MKIEFGFDTEGKGDRCLNPCSNGMKIEFLVRAARILPSSSLNPCSNGMKIE